MLFEFEFKKSTTNKHKHGIDFLEAQQLWNDPELLEIEAKTIDEARYLIIGKIGSKHWSAVDTYRNSSIRIISVRRSKKTEVALYEEN